MIQFLSTPSARRATAAARAAGPPREISIHALREEGDQHLHIHPPRSRISIHALREEGDPQERLLHSTRKYISIHALREEGDAMAHRRSGHRRDFYPRPPRGGRHKITGKWDLQILFLSTPSARRATPQTPADPAPAQFLSTPSARRATFGITAWITCSNIISIHALREEGDELGITDVMDPEQFLSTPSARRATDYRQAVRV